MEDASNEKVDSQNISNDLVFCLHKALVKGIQHLIQHRVMLKETMSYCLEIKWFSQHRLLTDLGINHGGKLYLNSRWFLGFQIVFQLLSVLLQNNMSNKETEMPLEFEKCSR